MLKLTTPIVPEVIRSLEVGTRFELHGRVLCGRDAVLPRIARMIEEGDPALAAMQLQGAVIFHTAVSPAGIGPTTSNKAEIMESIPALSRAGVAIHLGKGSVSDDTIAELDRAGSVFAVTPPVTALFSHRIKSQKIIAFEKEGMEALHEIQVEGLPGIVAAAHGQNIFDR